MTESEIYKGLSVLTKSRDKWEESIPYVSSLLESESVKIQAKALWLLGEMGLAFPHKVGDSLPAIASFLGSREPLLRERALNALGRIGRGCFPLVEPYWAGLFRFAHDGEAKVRLAFIWASENIATNTPDPYGEPEMFRVLGKRRPEFVEPCLDTLQWMAEHDAHPVVRIHSAGAIRVIGN